MALGLVLVVVANAFGLAVPWLVREAVDALAAPGVEPAAVRRFAGLIVLTAILGGLARYGMRECLNGVSRRVEYDLRNDFFQHLLRLDASYFGKTPTGEIMSRATNDIQAVRMTAGPAYMYLVNTFVVSISVIGLMLWIDPRLTLVALVPLLALPPVTVGFGRLIHQRFERIQETFGDLSTLVQENLSGIRLVKAYGQEEDQAARFQTVAEAYMDRNVALARVSGVFHPLLTLLSGAAVVGVLLVGGRAVMEGRITVGDFVAFLLYLGMLSWPMIALGWVITLFQRGAASMGRINAVLALDPTIQNSAAPRSIDPAQLRGEIEFRDVRFRYPGTDRDVLAGISFRVPAGSMLAIVGGTGSGKSTLAALLVRMYDPDAGEILLDGIPVQDLPLEQLRGTIGTVPQDTFLFSESIRDNLAFGLNDLDGEAEIDRRVRAAARLAQLDQNVTEFPGGYDTLLGERGVNLSGGQKQRAALARAVARDPRILILDDALSAVDTHTEAEILSGLRDVLRDRTSVVVSHRATAVMGADLILVLQDGRIVEQGTHAELLRLGGAYAALQRRQLLAEEVNR